MNAAEARQIVNAVEERKRQEALLPDSATNLWINNTAQLIEEAAKNGDTNILVYTQNYAPKQLDYFVSHYKARGFSICWYTDSQLHIKW